MKKYLSVLKNCRLFKEMEDTELEVILECLGAKCLSFRKEETIFHEGQAARQIGIVLTGAVQIVQNDFFGNRTIVTRIDPSGLFGESFACAGVTSLPVSVAAVLDSEILLMDCRRIINTCTNACAFHRQIIFNLLHVMAEKNLMFHQKIEITSKRTTREKLMAYLMAQAKQNQSSRFTIPYDRQSLADYLQVERSAMSAEISKLRKEGIIECHKCDFRIL
ncbi:MAG: Crp/Fnr family transcriptional regulator [Lachnospiraceae bacterium]